MYQYTPRLSRGEGVKIERARREWAVKRNECMDDGWTRDSALGEVEVPERGGPRGMSSDAARWALPKFPNATSGSRIFPLTTHLGGVKGPWGGPNLDAVDLHSLVDQPLAQLGLDRFFALGGGGGGDGDGNGGGGGGDVERERIVSGLGGLAVGSVGGLPFEVGQHAAAATPIARATLARLRADVRGAVDAAKGGGGGGGSGGGGGGGGGSDNTRNKDRFAHAHLRHLAPADAAAVTEEAVKASESGGGGGGVEAAAKLAAAGLGGAATAKAKSALTAILGELRSLMARDRAAATEAAAAATTTANGLSRDPTAARSMLRLGLNRRSGAWAEATFDDLIEGLLCDGGEKILARVTPGVGERAAAEVWAVQDELVRLTHELERRRVSNS